MRRLFRQFSFPGGIPSHVAPETPGSIHEGGELGYALAHAYGAAFDNPDLLVCCVVGDGEAETGPLAASWHSNKFLDPARDGAVLPVLHLNGYKIANPTVLARIPQEELRLADAGLRPRAAVRRGRRARGRCTSGWPRRWTRRSTRSAEIQSAARERRRDRAPALADDRAAHPEGLDRAEGGRRPARRGHVPLAPGAAVRGPRRTPEHLAQLEAWLRSYRPEELFDERRRPAPRASCALAPDGPAADGRQPHANGGLLLRDLRLPDFRDYAVDVPSPAATTAEATRVLGAFLRDSMRRERRRRLPALRPGRDRVEPPRTPCSRPPTGRGTPSGSTPTTTSRRTAA